MKIMNIFKRFVFNRLFNKHQRGVIWHAIVFSEHTYKRRGNEVGANRVRGVIDSIREIVQPIDKQKDNVNEGDILENNN